MLESRDYRLIYIYTNFLSPIGDTSNITPLSDASGDEGVSMLIIVAQYEDIFDLMPTLLCLYALSVTLDQSLNVLTQRAADIFELDLSEFRGIPPV